MFQDLENLLRAIPPLFWNVASAILALFVLWKVWQHTRFMWMRAWYEVPFIGRLSALAKHDQREGGSNWYRSERVLCGDFYRFLPPTKTKDEFVRATSYLTKVHEIGRREMPWYGWVIIFVLLVAEAISFGLLLAGYVAQNASMHEQTWVGYVVAVVLAVVLLAMTHSTGRQLHTNSLLKTAREWFANRPQGQGGKALQPVPGVCLAQDHLDDREPIYIQLAGRVKDPSGGRFKASYTVPLITLILVLAFGALSFYIRSQVYESLSVDETMSTPAALTDQPDAGSALPGAAGADTDIEAQLKGMTDAAQKRGSSERKASEYGASVAAFLALSFLFLTMQLVGVGAGLYFGFSGKESDLAARLRKGFATADEYVSFHRRERDHIASVAQSKLERLQQRMRQTTTSGNFDQDIQSRTFRQYVMEMIQEGHDEAHFVPVTPPAAAVPSPSAAPTLTLAPAPGEETEEQMRERLTREIREKLLRETRSKVQREAELRAQIEAQERARLSGRS